MNEKDEGVKPDISTLLPMSRRSFLWQTGSVAASVTASSLLPLSRVRGAAATEQGLALVKDGRPAASIVIAAAPTENARIAAQELQRYIEKMSGARLPILPDDHPVPGPVILVGQSRMTDEMPGLQLPGGVTKQLREEGYILHCGGGRLVLAGNDTEPYLGTRFAVYDLLYRLGIRWFLPGEFGEVVPQQRTIQVEPLLVLERPDFPMRNFWEHARDKMNEEREEWKIRSRMNPRMQEWFGVPGDGSISNYLPQDQFKTHPDWFAMRKDGSRDEHMACMTSPGMIAAFVERVKEDARKGKRVTAFAPEDGTPRCYCSNCMKMASAFDGYGTNDRDPWPESSTSQEWFHFVDSILKEVNKEFPDHKIATNGYSNREIPPELPDFNPSGNLVVMFANICACTIHDYDDPGCWQMQRQGQMVRQWARVCDKVWIYNYNYTMLVNKGTITPTVHRIRNTIPRLKEWGLVGFHDQDECDWSMCGIAVRVVRAQLEWNTHANVEEILEDFYQKWYGRAAKPMQAYYDALEKAFAAARIHGHEDVILPAIYTGSLMTVLDREIGSAEKLAQSDTERVHVRLDRLIHDHLREFVALDGAKQEGRYAEAAQHAGRMMALKAQMNQVTPFMGWHPYPTYDMDWEKARMEGLAAKTTGTVITSATTTGAETSGTETGGAEAVEGRLVTMLPVEARFRTDPQDDGRYERWQEPALDETGWSRLRTTAGWESQGLMDSKGHPYKGVAWYRMSVEVPTAPAGQEVRIFCPAVVNEAWVWVNGQYIGHRPYIEPWFRPQPLDLPVSQALKPGQNQITLRVLANFDVFGANGIYERPFLYQKLKV